MRRRKTNSGQGKIGPFALSKKAQGVYRRFVRFLDILEVFERKELVCLLNAMRWKLHQYSPFRDEPVDCVVWVDGGAVQANDYNPNRVAPPEMELLERSILHDGYTQPIVSWKREDGVFEVVDGFHRNRVGKESASVRERLGGFLPVTIIKSDRTDKTNRIAATIRHNRARGKHQVEGMSDIVIELKRRNWTDNKIAKELGMEPDEVLRLCQINGLVEMFSDVDFSRAWDIGIFDDEDLEGDLISDVEGNEKTKDEDVSALIKSGKRVYHTWEKWECYKAGFYEDHPPKGMTDEEAIQKYVDLLSDISLFSDVLEKVITEWKYSCEHYLTNERMNRLAWLGQAALAYKHHIPSKYRVGYHRLTEEQQKIADEKALEYLNKWRDRHGLSPLSIEEAQSKTEPNLY